MLRDCLDEALRDVRDLCSGLTLPELEGRSVADVLDSAIRAHERRSGATVDRLFRHDPLLSRPAPHPYLICIYRFVQEGLMNAFRHARGARVGVDARVEAGRITIHVRDEGPGFDPGVRTLTGLGLPGLRERVESIGGLVDFDSRPRGGTHLSMTLPAEDEG